MSLVRAEEHMEELSNAFNTTQVGPCAVLVRVTPSGTPIVKIFRTSSAQAPAAIVWIDPLNEEDFAWGPMFSCRAPLDDVKKAVEEIVQYIEAKRTLW
jgi:hypothetical protein